MSDTKIPASELQELRAAIGELRGRTMDLAACVGKVASSNEAWLYKRWMGQVPRTLYCSFCGKSQHEATTLIAGPSVFICDACVRICIDIVDTAGEPAAAGGDA